MMKLVVALVLVATAAADDFNFFHSVAHKMQQQQNSNCSVCGSGLGSTTPTLPAVGAAGVCTSFVSTTTVTGNCGSGGAYTATCVNGVLTNTGNAVATKTGTTTVLSCAEGVPNQATAVTPCTTDPCAKAAAINAEFEASGSNLTAGCQVTNCTVSGRRLRQAVGTGVVTVGCPCPGNDPTCCVDCLRAFQCAGADISTCYCGVAVIPCPGCSSKDSNKLLLLLLLLLLLIPLILCCLLLLCCLLRRKKREADTHFSTFDPQGPICTPIPGPMMPVPTCHAPMTLEHCGPVMEHCIPEPTHCLPMPASHCGPVGVLPTAPCF